MLISIALALLATANGLSLKLKKRKIRTKRDFAAKTIEKVRWERDTDMVHTDMDHMDMDHDMNMPMATMMVKKIQNLNILKIRNFFYISTAKFGPNDHREDGTVYTLIPH